MATRSSPIVGAFHRDKISRSKSITNCTSTADNVANNEDSSASSSHVPENKQKGRCQQVVTNHEQRAVLNWMGDVVRKSIPLKDLEKGLMVKSIDSLPSCFGGTHNSDSSKQMSFWSNKIIILNDTDVGKISQRLEESKVSHETNDASSDRRRLLVKERTGRGRKMK